MPWRLILFIVIFAVFLAFITFNLENRCDISFGFTEIENVPVFLTVFISFGLGLICALPVALHVVKKRKEIPAKDKKQEASGGILSNKKPVKDDLSGSSNAVN